MEETKESQQFKSNNLLPVSIIIAALIIAGAWVYNKRFMPGKSAANLSEQINALAGLEKEITPDQGVVLPVKWNDLGRQLVESGVIDQQKFNELYASRGGLSEADKKFLMDSNNGNIKITEENSGLWLNLFWALGLGSKNPILENGPMSDAQYGGVENFASTGGWTLAQGNTMDHYSRHNFFALTADQQALVEAVAKNIYRPCCDNATYFPDCNHGMAMLGLLELMAFQGASEKEMYQAALAINSYWFKDKYLTLAEFLKSKNIKWQEVDPKNIVGAELSSASGFRRVMSQMEPRQPKSGGSCGV